MMNHFLFVCTVNMLRSPTAEHVARLAGFSADSAGTDPSSVRVLTQAALNKAERVVCMEEKHRMFVLDNFHVPAGVVVECWHVPDDFNYCDPDLVKMLQDKLKVRSQPDLVRILQDKLGVEK